MYLFQGSNICQPMHLIHLIAKLRPNNTTLYHYCKLYISVTLGEGDNLYCLSIA